MFDFSNQSNNENKYLIVFLFFLFFIYIFFSMEKIWKRNISLFFFIGENMLNKIE